MTHDGTGTPDCLTPVLPTNRLANTTRFLPHTTRLAIRAVLSLVAIIAAIAVGFAAQAWWRHPDLSPWHTARLGNELKAGPGAPQTLTEYLALEDRLFAELRQTLYASPPPCGRERA